MRYSIYILLGFIYTLMGSITFYVVRMMSHEKQASTGGIMGLTPSTMRPLGTPSPDFSLTDTVSGRRIALADFKAKKGLLVLFICNH